MPPKVTLKGPRGRPKKVIPSPKKTHPPEDEEEKEESSSDEEEEDEEKETRTKKKFAGKPKIKQPKMDYDGTYDNQAKIKPQQQQRDVMPVVSPFKGEMYKDDYTVLAIGKRREGKTFFADWLLFGARGWFSRAVVFTNTRVNGFWQNKVPDRYVFDGVQEGVMEAILEKQKKDVEYCYTHPEEDINPRMIWIFDDCINQDMHHSETLRTLFYNGRHLRISVLFMIQYAKGLPPGMRENADLSVLFRLHSEQQVEAAAENFLGHWNKKIAKEIIDTWVWKEKDGEQRQCVIVDQSNNVPIDESIFACQPQEVPPYVLGCDEFWLPEVPFEKPQAQSNFPPVKAPNPAPTRTNSVMV